MPHQRSNHTRDDVHTPQNCTSTSLLFHLAFSLGGLFAMRQPLKLTIIIIITITTRIKLVFWNFFFFFS